MTALYSVPPVVLLLVAIVIAVAVAAGGQIYVHHRFSKYDFRQHNEVGGFIISIVGTLYAVLLGFLTVAAWQHYAEAGDLVASETAAATDAWHTAVGLPAPTRARVRSDILKYANLMIDQDWPDMQQGSLSKAADVVIMDAIGTIGDFLPANLRESNAQTATLQQLGVLHDYRLRRILGSASGVTWFEWLILFVGAICVIAFCWLFGSQNARAHLLMTSTVAIIVASTLVLLFELQYPFRGPIGIGSDAWQATVEHIHLMQTNRQMNMQM